MKYQLPCSCGKTVPIEAGQAGQQVRCVCGNELDVPTLRLIRQLEPVGTEAVATSKRSRTWTGAQRVVFAWGLAVMACGLGVAAFYQWNRLTLDTEQKDWDIWLESDLELLEDVGLEGAWANWLMVRDSGIGPYTPPTYVRSRIISEHWLRLVQVGLGVTLVGLTFVLGAFFLPGADRRQSRSSRGKQPPAPQNR